MKAILSILFISTFNLIVLSQSVSYYGSYKVQSEKPTVSNPSIVNGQYSQPSSVPYNPPSNTFNYSTPKVEEKTITLKNTSTVTKEVEIYVRNQSSFEWEYLQTSRLIGGQTISYLIGANELHSNYGYIVVGSNSTIVLSFSSFPLIIV
jgi:hypothetical protein